VYYPHPETKLRHFQNPSVLEVIAMPIADLVYGESLQLLINSQEISLLCTSSNRKASLGIDRGRFIVPEDFKDSIF
jgi:hypothetical protein